MKRLFLIVAILLALSTSAAAEIGDGFHWVEMNRDAKLWYIKGVDDTLAVMALFSYVTTRDEDATAALYGPYPGTYGDLVNEIDLYYIAYTNRDDKILLTMLHIMGTLDAWMDSPGFREGWNDYLVASCDSE